MSYSLRRVLAVRFSLTMLVALSLIALWALIEVERGPAEHETRDLLMALAGTVLLGTLASAFGAFWLARSAVAPVVEVAAQARTMRLDTGNPRITVHADVEEYASLIGVLNDLLDRTGRAMATQRRFIGDVGHELRTPLAALQGSIEVALRSERTPRDYQLVLQDALEEVEHLGRMSESLMLITRAESGLIQPHLSPTDLNQLTVDLVDRLRRRLEEKGIVVDTTLVYDGPRPMLDQQLVARVLRELLDNAVKFSPHGGRLAVGTSKAPGALVWWVEDSGPGIPTDDLPRLFEAFYRVDPARTRDSGSGLGLTLAACITRLHGGAIRVDSPPAGGARFELEFPATAS